MRDILVLNKTFKDTVNDAAAVDVAILGKVKLDKLSKATGVVVVHRLSVSKSFHDGTRGGGGEGEGEGGAGERDLLIHLLYIRDNSDENMFSHSVVL